MQNTYINFKKYIFKVFILLSNKSKLLFTMFCKASYENLERKKMLYDITKYDSFHL